jgi:simple sugar transport system permease protein
MQRLKIRPITLYGLFTALVFLSTVLFFSIFTPDHLFLDPRNLGSIMKLTPDIGIVALGIGILMIAGEFDLSIASIIPFCSYIFTLLIMNGMDPLIAFILVFPVGATFGLINGLLVVSTGLPSFIITLSTMLFWRGLLYGLSRMMPISIIRYVSDTSLESILTGQVGPIPVQILWFSLFAVILGLMLHQTKFGNWIYATGSNQEAARAMGINVRMVKTVCYMIIGVLCAWAAVMQAVRLGSFAATQGIGFELKTIAAVVVGGVALTGGVGNMLGIVLGIFVIRILENGVILMKWPVIGNLPVFGIDLFIGIAVVIFVLLNTYVSRRMIRQDT